MSFVRKAPNGKFRVIGADTYDGEGWVKGDFDTLEQATKHMDEYTKDKNMLKMHIYNDTGRHRYEAGRY